MSRTGQVSSRFGQAGIDVPMHRHPGALLVLGLRGGATIGTPDREWTLSPRAMLWLADATPHRLRTTTDHHSLVLSFAPGLVARATGSVEASGFVRDLVERLGDAPSPERRERLAAVLVDELAEPGPANTRRARVIELVARDPATSVAALACEVGMSERTFRRWFRADAGATFTRWREQRIVERAIEQLRRGDSVKRVAADVGYASPSAFTAMFKRVTRASPLRYLRSR